MMRFVDLINQNMEELARLLSSEHGKTIADAKGDVQRGLEVAEFAIGIPHLLKGEYTESAGTGIDVFFHAPAARRRGRHHAVQFSGNDTAVEGGAGHRLRQCVHSQAVGARPVRAAAPG